MDDERIEFGNYLLEELENRKIEFNGNAINEGVENYDKSAIEIQEIMFRNDENFYGETLQSNFALVNIVRNCIRIAKNKAKKTR